MGIVAMATSARTKGPWLSLLGALSFVAASSGLCVLFGFDGMVVLQTAARWLTGATWSIWFAASVSWRRLRRSLDDVAFLSSSLELVDVAYVQGSLIRAELVRRRAAAINRHGWTDVKKRIGNVGTLFASVVEQSFRRADRLDETLALRKSVGSAACPTTNVVLNLLNVTVGDGSIRKRLCNVSLNVERGAFIVLTGRSGAGKTSLLRFLAGLDFQSEGVLARFGKEVVGRSPQARVDGRVALVFQEPDDQFFASDVRSDLLWGLKQIGLSGDEATQRIDSVLSDLQLEQLADRDISTLSFGERKRLALATAIVVRPQILLCDEPTMGLDPATSQLVADAIDKLAKVASTTVVWATHDLQLLPKHSRTLWVMHEGRMLSQSNFIGPPASGNVVASNPDDGFAGK